MRVPGSFKPITIQSGGQAPERKSRGHDLKGGTLLFFIQICPFEIKFMLTFQNDQRTIFWGLLKIFYFASLQTSNFLF